jgi:hypothetical protein
MKVRTKTIERIEENRHEMTSMSSSEVFPSFVFTKHTILTLVYMTNYLSLISLEWPLLMPARCQHCLSPTTSLPPQQPSSTPGGSSTVVEGGLIQRTLENDECDIQSKIDDDGGGNDDYDNCADDNGEAATCVESDEYLDMSKKLSLESIDSPKIELFEVGADNSHAEKKKETTETKKKLVSSSDITEMDHIDRKV